MGKQSLFASALALMTAKVYAAGSLSECLTEEDVTLVDISTVQYSMSWEMTLDPGDSCWYLTFNTAYATWDSDSDISVKYQTYRPPFGDTEETCQPTGDPEDYSPNELVHTDQTVWPNNDPDICSHLFVFTNESQDFEQTLLFFTNGGLLAFGAGLVGAIASFMLF